ncbi:prepilin-type N-terminal cleavage/methylation domain-containing protein [Shewanella intestini]|uniref:type II secretion system protein n=1 Tax=Shewanella TaxID=22 RepID=UPI0012995F22|nr:type II secretion system protein [Shewanella sp. XMDDZSB0408]MRG36853.1 prepilin-type N-terminal cleavage/methylation domain-containing protein [Shewanella sp. XMDDZSB0408]
MRFKRVNPSENGFTLIELVIGMLVLSIALVMMTSMLFPQADRAAQTLQRVRSAELAHSVMNEIWGKRYDQNTNPNGGTPACGITGLLACSDTLGPETGEGRNDYNDVDDYQGLTINSNMFDSSDTYLDHYPNFGLEVSVAYVVPATKAAKLITVTVTTPNNEVITYQSVRSNY